MTDPKPRLLPKPLDPGRQLGVIRFSPCGKVLAAGGFECAVHRWDSAWSALPPLAGHNGWVNALAFHADGKRLFSADSWGRLCCWAFADRDAKPLWTVPEAHAGWVRKLAVSPDGKTVATCGRDGFVRLWDADKGTRRAEHAHGEDVLALAFAPDGSLTHGDLRGVIVRRDAAGKEMRRYDARAMYKLDRIQDVGGVRVLLFDPEGKTLIAGGGQPTTGGFVQGAGLLMAFDAATGAVKQSVTIGATNDGYVMDGLWHPSGYIALVTSGQPGVGKLVLHRVGGSAPFFTAPVPNPHSLALHPDGKRLVVSATSANSSGNGRNLTKDKKYPGNSSPLHTWQIAS